MDSEAYQRFPLFTAEKYVEYAHVAQEYAQLNRKRIIMEIVTNILGLSFDPKHYSESVHNYMERQGDDTPSLMVRKGAISAKEHEQVIIPFKSPGDIIDVIQGNTIDIHAIIHPVFNLKDRGRDEDRKVNFQPPSRDIEIGI